MTPRQALAICELSDLPLRQDATHSAAKVVVPKIMPLVTHLNALACTWEARLSGVSYRASAFIRAMSLARGSENCLIVVCLARSLASGAENCARVACRRLFLSSGFAFIFLRRAICASMYCSFRKRALAFWLMFCRHFSSRRNTFNSAFFSVESLKPELPSPPSVRLHSPSDWYLRISSRSSSNAHHSCIPFCTISMV